MTNLKQLIFADIVIMALVSMAICSDSSDIKFMQSTVFSLLAMRVGIVYYLQPQTAHRNTIFLVFCFVVGALNDWNTVVRHNVYRYTAASDLGPSTIPSWMLAYWGIILNLLAELGVYFARGKISNQSLLPAAERQATWFKLGFSAVLLIVTKICIFEFYSDPLWSWLPYMAALGLYCIVFPLRKAEWLMALTTAFFGTLLEIIYVNFGKLHAYTHGAVFGVAIWVLFWWVLAALIWQDIALRFYKILQLSPTDSRPSFAPAELQIRH